MDRFLVPFLASLLGGGAGAVAASRLVPAPARAAEPSAEVRGIEELREELATFRRLLVPIQATSDLRAVRRERGTEGSAGAGAGTGAAAATTITAADLAAVADKAATAALERHEAATKATKEKEVAESARPRKPLAEVAREIGLTASQETDVRNAHREAGEKYLKLFAEPEGDTEAFRRELESIKNDPAKKAEMMTRLIPKVFTKLGDVMAIEAARDQKIRASVGNDGFAKLKRYKLEEEDPYDMDGSMVLGIEGG